MDCFYVYVYYKAVTMEPIYVGKGTGDRYLKHLESSLLAGHTLFYRKLYAMLSRDDLPIIKIYKNNLSEIEAFQLEERLIKHWGRLDLGTGCLCNHTNGGEGQSGRICLEDTRTKIACTKIGSEQSIDTRIKMSKPHSEAAKLKKRETATIDKGRRICSINIEGKVVRIFESINAATRRFGYDASSICHVLDGSKKSCGGYFWRDAQESDVPLLVD